jgi:hypothetical protein
MSEDFLNVNDKFDAAVALQPEANRSLPSTNNREVENGKTVVFDCLLNENKVVAVENPELNFGPVEILPDYLKDASNNEETAWSIQGMIFRDDDFGWCEVTGWDVDYGVIVMYYMPVGQKDLLHEHHTSLLICYLL